MVGPDWPQKKTQYCPALYLLGNRATDMHSEFVTILFHSNKVYAKKPHHYDIRILLDLFEV